MKLITLLLFSLGLSQWVEVPEGEIIIPAGESIAVPIIFDISNLEAGNYQQVITIITNDPEIVQIELPVSVSVLEKPKLKSIADIPNDQGGWVSVVFFSSIYDDSEPARLPEMYTIEMDYGDGWTAANSLTAYGEDIYTMLVHTPIDSSDEISGEIDFRVIASMEEGIWISDAAQGYSVDNIVPDQPVLTQVEVDDVNLSVQFSWQPNQNEDFETFQVHRNGEYVESLTALSFTEMLPPVESVEYSVYAMDVHGNLSDPAIETIQYSSKTMSIGNTLLSLTGELENTSVSYHLDNILADGVIVNFLIGQGVGLFYNEDDWSGNLNDFNSEMGYWINLGSNYTWNMFYEELKQPCDPYSTAIGNNLLSYTGFEGAPTLEALGGEEYASEHFQFIIGQGVGLFNTGTDWSGNLNNLSRTNGYWVNISDNIDFTWGFENCAVVPDVSLSKTEPQQNIPEAFRFTQSTEQAFYLIKDIKTDGNQPQQGDILLAYNDDILVGSVEYDGAYTPVPVMGRDISPQTEGFCEVGDIPKLKLFKPNNGDIIDLNGDIEGWTSLGVYTVESLIGHTIKIPTEFVLHPAYPNPFNPVTTIKFGVPLVETLRVTSLRVYDINGRTVETLLNGAIKPGYHAIEWDATGLPSGVYFVKLTDGEFSQSHKVMLLK